MLAANNLLEALARNDEAENYTDSNNDYDFGKVLEFYKSTEPVNERNIRYSDGQEKHFSFDDQGEKDK